MVEYESGYNPGRDNLTGGEKRARGDAAAGYTLLLLLNGAEFWFRNEDARQDFADTFRRLRGYGHSFRIVVDGEEVSRG